MGFDLKNEPRIFPEIWTGDETRYASTTDQQLRPYESYEIFRYFENIAPGRNGGGWVDPSPHSTSTATPASCEIRSSPGPPPSTSSSTRIC